MIYNEDDWTYYEVKNDESLKLPPGEIRGEGVVRTKEGQIKQENLSGNADAD